MAADAPLILVIDDEPQILRFLRIALAGAGYRVAEADTGKQGLALAVSQPPELILLDLGLPDMDGLDLARQVRTWSGVPIIVLTARGLEKDKVAALDLGADDYLTKPFGVGELLARIRVALRHSSRVKEGPPDPVFASGALKVDLAARQVFLNGTEVRLTPLEYRLLALMVQHAGKVLTHTFLLKEIWGPSSVHQTHYLRVFMANLRHKLEETPARPTLLLTEPGVGYRLVSGND